MKSQIVVDDRERNAELLAALNSMQGLEILVARLEAGDFLIDESVLIERKTAFDFAVSLVDGRLFSQASRLVRSPFRVAYIVEGSAEDWREIGVSRESLQGAIISLMLVFDIPVLRAIHAKETARLLAYAGRQLMRAGCDGDIPIRKIKAKRRATRQRRVLQALPGVGSTRARALLDHFGSVRACLTAGPEDWSAVEGIGPNTAAEIERTVK